MSSPNLSQSIPPTPDVEITLKPDPLDQTMEMLARLYEHANDEQHVLDDVFADATCRACGMPWPCVVEEVRLYLPEHLR